MDAGAAAGLRRWRAGGRRIALGAFAAGLGQQVEGGAEQAHAAAGVLAFAAVAIACLLHLAAQLLAGADAHFLPLGFQVTLAAQWFARRLAQGRACGRAVDQALLGCRGWGRRRQGQALGHVRAAWDGDVGRCLVGPACCRAGAGLRCCLGPALGGRGLTGQLRTQWLVGQQGHGDPLGFARWGGPRLQSAGGQTGEQQQVQDDDQQSQWPSLWRGGQGGRAHGRQALRRGGQPCSSGESVSGPGS